MCVASVGAPCTGALFDRKDRPHARTSRCTSAAFASARFPTDAKLPPCGAPLRVPSMAARCQRACAPVRPQVPRPRRRFLQTWTGTRVSAPPRFWCCTRQRHIVLGDLREHGRSHGEAFAARAVEVALQRVRADEPSFAFEHLHRQRVAKVPRQIDPRAISDTSEACRSRMRWPMRDQVMSPRQPALAAARR
jgi:hypothetical protein